MNIFLSGKMDAEHGSWRDALLGTRWNPKTRKPGPVWEVVREMEVDDMVNDAPAPPAWPRTANQHVLDLHNYVGPYRVTWSWSEEQKEMKYLGYFHGTMWRGCHGTMDEDDQKAVVQECKAAIQRADLVFAYINSPDCFGTIAEIALAHALGKYVHVVSESGAHWDWDDYWFVGNLADQYFHYNRPQDQTDTEFIREAFREALVRWTARPARRPDLALVPSHPEFVQFAQVARSMVGECAQSLSQISQWTSDPRVRNEAQRMLNKIAQ